MNLANIVQSCQWNLALGHHFNFNTWCFLENNLQMRMPNDSIHIFTITFHFLFYHDVEFECQNYEFYSKLTSPFFQCRLYQTRGERPSAAWPSAITLHGLGPSHCTALAITLHGLHPSQCMAFSHHAAWPSAIILHGLVTWFFFSNFSGFFFSRS